MNRPADAHAPGTAHSAPQAPPETDRVLTATDDRERLLWAATALAERGWRVFPCQPGGKRPALRADWEHRATTDTGRIARCWRAGPYNIGVACGPSGLIVIDLDTPKPGEAKPDRWARDTGVNDGADVLAALCDAEGQPWPAGTTFTVATPSGGTHLYFTAPPALTLRNTARKLGWLIDTRATGGYVVGPGSVIGCTPYTIVNPDPPEPLPAWLAARLTAAPAPPEWAGPPPADMGEHQGTGYALAALRGEVDRVLLARPGTRNDTLNHAAFALGQLTAAGLLPPKLAYDALMRAAHSIGLPPREAARTIGSGLGSGARQPRSAA
jgi:hypothetical protein